MTGNATISQLPDIAIVGLEEGLDSPSLWILAGLNKNENPFQVDDYFRRTLQELNIKLPDKRQAAIEFGIAIAEQIIAGKIDLIIGTKQIIDKAIHNYDFFSETENYCYDSIGFETVYGVYYNYEDLVYADHPWQVDKTNEELLTEVKAELLEELRKWIEKYKNGA
ncbi:MAG: hypothetical protein ABI472_22905 [Ginsengibacter sp.]